MLKNLSAKEILSIDDILKTIKLDSANITQLVDTCLNRASEYFKYSQEHITKTEDTYYTAGYDLSIAAYKAAVKLSQSIKEIEEVEEIRRRLYNLFYYCVYSEICVKHLLYNLKNTVDSIAKISDEIIAELKKIFY